MPDESGGAGKGSPFYRHGDVFYARGEELDLLVDALKQIAREAEENPELVQTAPHTTRIQRLDETTAARKPVLRWKGPVAKTPLTPDSAAKEW